MNKMPIKYNPLVNNVLQLGQRTGHCTAGIFKNIISNVTKNEEAGHGPVPCPSKAKWENERKEDEV